MNHTPVQPPLLSSRFADALVYTTQLHATQVRKGGTIPYISHLLSVTALVLEDGGDEDEAIAALLHDAIEDQGGDRTRQEIHRRFGDRVTAIVEGCTDADITPKPPWQQRKESYLKRLKTASPAVQRVSLADKLHNARSLLMDYRQHGEGIWQRFQGGKLGTLWFYTSLLQVYQTHCSSSFVQELERTLCQLQALVK